MILLHVNCHSIYFEKFSAIKINIDSKIKEIYILKTKFEKSIAEVHISLCSPIAFSPNTFRQNSSRTTQNSNQK